MKVRQRYQEFVRLRLDYPTFEYLSYDHHLSDEELQIRFAFRLSEDYTFYPQLFIPKNDHLKWDRLDRDALNNFVFHLGMVELISYWKLACSPVVIIHPHQLNAQQVAWWKKLYFHGLGEFLYLNGIVVESDALMHIQSQGEPLPTNAHLTLDSNKVIVPVGGGKDSVVTLELLQASDLEVFPLVVNMNPAMERTINNAGISSDHVLRIQRKLDPLMLELNDKGFLNGHTPFSALLAFVSVLVASAAGVRHIALSNENSANESTVPETKINHQYSKSFEFESDFRWFIHHFVDSQINYFSFLRPLSELQIAWLFSGFESHLATFRSCNVGSKSDTWCGACPKCLFTYIILSPFIPLNKLRAVFNKDLLEESGLKNTFLELTGRADIKPFECVGTPAEVNQALNQAFYTTNANPVLLRDYPLAKSTEKDFQALLRLFNDEHALDSRFVSILKNALDVRITKSNY